MEVPCPTCDEGRESEFRLWFNVEKNIGICYKCQESFTPVKLVMALEGVRYEDALRLLKENTASSGVFSLARLKQHIEESFAPKETKSVEELPEVDLPDDFRPCSRFLSTEWPPYILKRIGSAREAKALGIGWCRGGYYAQRMVIPVRLGGRLVSFVARDMTGKAEKKVLYPKGAKTSRLLFNYDRAHRFERVVLTEGVLDAIRVGPSAMALFGTHLSDAQVALLAASRAREVVLMLDGDAAGREGTQKILKRLGLAWRTRVVDLPDGRDPDDFDRAWLSARVASATAPDLARSVHRALESQ
jgi:Toprim-like